MDERKIYRSWMFVPGDRQRMIDKSGSLPVDAILFDIEDAVAPAEKGNARRQIAAALDQVAARPKASISHGNPGRFVRINAVGHKLMHEDLAAIVRPGLDGLALPKIETVDQIQMVEDILDAREGQMGIRPKSVRLLVAIETPRGMFNALALAGASLRVIGLMFGGEDFSRELGLPLQREAEARDMLYARSTLVMAAAAAHIQAVDGVWTDLQDAEGLKKYSLQSRRLGFSGMAVIHPTQIEAVNAAFSPTAAELEYARRVLQAFDEAQARGAGAVAFQGQMLDPPVVDRARQTVQLAESHGG